MAGDIIRDSIYQYWCRDGNIENVTIDDIITRSYGQMSNEEYFLLYDLACIEKQGWCIEIGSLHGKSTAVLALASRNHNLGKVISIDNDYDVKRLSTFKANLTKFGLWDYVIPIVSDSVIACSIVNGIEVRLLFIDGDHGYDAVHRDITLYSSLLATGGYIIFHDYGREYGVDIAVNEEIVDSGKYSDIVTKETLLYAKKKC